jgi:class 3 adenylate cyclase
VTASTTASPRPVRIVSTRAEATRKGHYQGKGVHLAARIGALANGGEVLASRAVVAHLNALPILNFRTVKQKGLSEPIEVASIDW